jgi:hypothetical protein
MYQTAFYPLRTVVGNTIAIAGKKKPEIHIIEESAESKSLGIQYEFDHTASLADTLSNSHYQHYLPVFEVPRREPAVGMDTLPHPAPFPFDVHASVISLFALSKTPKSADVSRKLSVKLHIKLSQEALVGGICYGGFPYLPYRIMETGESSSNFGLPREVRLTCLGGPLSLRFPIRDFIDAENSVTKQDIISHSGLHFLCTDPMRTDSLILHLSDFPSILTKVQAGGRIEEKYGFIIPYFYVFEYQEKTRYQTIVPAGLLGAMRTPDPDLPVIAIDNNPPPGYSRVVQAISNSRLVDYSGNRGKVYADFTCASMLGQQRVYPAAKGHETSSECFVSDPIGPGKKITLFIQQAEDYDRCIAGLKVFFPFIPEVDLAEDLVALTAQLSTIFPNIDLTLLAGVPRETLETALRTLLRLPEGVDFCEKIGIRVYELDPLDGVSPLLVPLDSKYATLLADQQIDELAEIGLAMFLEGIKFNRPSHAKYFAIELTNLDDKKGQFVVKRLALIQSAHVSVHPRASHTQQIKVLNFRIIGANLAEDYAALGNEGFNFSIERFVAGERKSVLFKANGILDLLHTGAAKIFSNVRRRAVESYQSMNSGWRRTEAGDGVTGINYWTDSKLKKIANDQRKFEVFNAQEIRNHSQILVPEIAKNKFWKAMADYFNVIQAVHTLGGEVDKISPNGDLNGTWKNPDWNSVLEFPDIDGLQSLGVNPFSPVVTIIEALENLVGQGKITLESAFESVRDLLGVYLFGSTALLITGGGTSSVSVSPGGLGLNLGVNPIPTINNHSTHGSTGTITKQASETNYSYAQYLNTGYDESIVTHAEVPGTDRQRVKGAEVMWQNQLVDIITGSIPLNFTLPATASKMHHRTADESLRVRFGSGVGKSISVDFWFDMVEEVIHDDY